MKKMLKIYFKIVLIGAMQFTFSSCFMFEKTLGDMQSSEMRIRADQTLTAVEDACVRQNATSKNFGKTKKLKVQSGNASEMQALVKFNVPAISAKIVKAALKIYASNGTDNGPKIHKTGNNWSETSVNWSNKPGPTGAVVSNPGSIAKKSWQTIDVTSSVAQNSTLSFIFIPESSDGVSFDSKESKNKPQLIIETDAGGGGGGGGGDGGGGGTGTGHFTTSSGTTDLNYADTVAFAAEYKKLGYTHDKYVQKVTKSGLKSLLTSNTMFNFHSGHGSDGGMIVCTDGNIFAKDLSGAVQTQHSIFATCITLASKDWFNAFGANAKMIMGFTKVINDGSALAMAKGFNKNITSGQSYVQAWHKTNVAIADHKDRWAIYVKEGTKIVLYSAMTGNTPARSYGGTPVVFDKVTIDSNLLAAWDSTVKFNSNFQVAVVDEMEVALEGNRPLDAWPSDPSIITAEQAQAIAQGELNTRGSLPVQAQLDTVVPIQKCDSLDVCSTTAYQISFIQKYNGLDMRSNSAADHVSTLVNDTGIASMDLQWSQVTPLDNAVVDRSTMLTVGQALRRAAPANISGILRKAVTIVEFKEVYGVSTDEESDESILVPAYEFIGQDGERFVVSAVTGNLIY